MSPSSSRRARFSGRPSSLPSSLQTKATGSSYYNLVDSDGLFELFSELSSAYAYFGGKKDEEMGEAQDYQNALEEVYMLFLQAVRTPAHLWSSRMRFAMRLAPNFPSALSAPQRELPNWSRCRRSSRPSRSLVAQWYI